MSEGEKHSEPLSPMDSSPEALAERFEKRRKSRKETKGTKLLRDVIREFEREKGKGEPAKPTEQISPTGQPQVAEQLLKAAQAMERTTQQQREQMQQFGSTYELFINAEWLQAPIRTDFENWPPTWFRELSADEQRLIRTRTQLANAAFIKIRVGNRDARAAQENEFLLLPREEFQLLYDMPGVKKALEGLVEELFEPHETQTDAYFKPKLKEGAAKKLERLDEFRENIQRKIRADFIRLGQGKSEAEINSKAAVSAAWNFFYLCNAIESADYQRKAPFNRCMGEQVRTLMHPAAKARGKFVKEEVEKIGTEEGWGGRLGVWLADRATYDPNFKRKLINDEIHPFPETLFASLLELTPVEQLKDQAGNVIREVTLAEKLYKKERIDFGPSNEVIPVEIFGNYQDTWDTALKAADFVLGAKPIDTSKPWKETLPLLASELADIIAKMRGKPLKEHYENPEFLLYCICNSVGVLEYTSELILRGIPGNIYGNFVEYLLNQPRLVNRFNESGTKDVMEENRVKEFIKKMLHVAYRERISIERQRSTEYNKRQKGK